MAISDRSGQLVNLSEASKNFIDLVRPRVTTTQANASDNARADSIITQLLGTSQDDHQALIDSILQRSAIDFAPVRAAEIGSGGYNSSVLAQLQTEARARATGEATGAVTQAQTEAARTAANLEAAKLNANKTTTQQPPTSIGALLKTVGVSVAAGKLLGLGLNKIGWTDAPAKAVPGNSEAVYNYLGTSEGAAAYDSGTGAFAGYGGGAVSGGSSSGSVVGTSFGVDSGLSASEIAQITGGAGDAVLGNTAAFASLTDSSVLGGAGAVPGIFGDFSAPLAATATEATTSGVTALGGGSGVVGGGAGYGAVAGGAAPGAAVDIGTGASAAAAGGSDVLSAASSASALGEGAAAAEGTAEGAAAATGAGAELLGPLIAIPIAATVAAKVGANFFEDLFGGEQAGAVGSVGNFFGDIGTNAYHGVENIGQSISNFFGW
jgi:hypothetical protein